MVMIYFRVFQIIYILFILLQSYLGVKGEASFSRVCYLTPSSLPPSKVNSSLCTHIIAGFGSVRDGLIYLGTESDKKAYKETTDLKKGNSNLKVLLTIGGGGNDDGFSYAFNSTINRTRFIVTTLVTLYKYNFDGLDIDWEFPVWNDNTKEDKGNFVNFLQEFVAIGKFYANAIGRNRLLLTVAVAAPQNIVDSAYDVPQMAKSVDFINLMSYDFHDFFWYTPFTGHNSPLFNRSSEKAYFATLNTAWAAAYWNKLGMPKSKIMVGVPTYGHSYTLVNPDINGVDAPAVNSFGDVTFPQVCSYLSKGAHRVFDNQSQVPYLYLGYDWISYEDTTSIYGKAKWIKSEGYGGAMTYNLNSDDWNCDCGEEPFILHRALYNAFNAL